MEDERGAASLKDKLKGSFCLSCCFRGSGRVSGGGSLESPPSEDDRPRLIRASSTWLRSRAQDLPEFRDKCRSLISRIGRSRRSAHDFRYDPLSYALNFDEGSFEDDGGGNGGGAEEYHRLRNFSARLPASPPPPPPRSPPPASVAAPREIAAFS